jgi:hypothetical protein
MRRLIMLAAFLLPTPLAAQTAPSDWRVAAVDAEGEAGRTVGRSVGFVDLGSIARVGDRVAFTIEIHFLNQRDPGGANRMRSHMLAECAAHRWASSDTILYRDAAELSRLGATPSEAVPPGTNGYAVIEAVCTGHFLSGPIADRAAHARSLLAPH